MTTEHEGEIPAYCGLTEDEIEDRQPRVEALLDRLEDVEELERGYRFTFPGQRETFDQVAAFAANERVCCPMLDFEIAFSGPEEPIELAMTAPEGMDADFKRDVREGLGIDCCGQALA